MLNLNGEIQAMGACMTRQVLRLRFVLASGGQIVPSIIVTTKQRDERSAED